MLTIDALREYGADIETGLGRCMGSEDFYFRLIGMVPASEEFGKLEEAVKAGDLDGAFEAAHSLKGVTGNLALTPIYDPVVEITELLRARTDMDYTDLLQTILDAKDRLAALL